MGAPTASYYVQPHIRVHRPRLIEIQWHSTILNLQLTQARRNRDMSGESIFRHGKAESMPDYTSYKLLPKTGSNSQSVKSVISHHRYHLYYRITRIPFSHHTVCPDAHLQLNVLPAQHCCTNPHSTKHLFNDTGHETSGDGAATLTDVEALANLDGVGLVELGNHLDVVARHDHLGVRILGALGEVERDGLVGGTEVDLGAVVAVEAGVAATLLLGEDVERAEELLVRTDLAGNGHDHAAPNVLTADTTEEKAGVVTSAGLLARLLEGLDVGDLGLDDLLALANKLDLSVALEDTALNTARDDGATARDGEDVLDGHEEGLLEGTVGGGNPRVDGLEKLVDPLVADLGPLVLHGAERGAHDDGGVVALEAVVGEQLTHLHLDELQHLGVLDGVDLVDEDDDPLDTDLAGEEQMLPGLGHLAVRGGDDDDGAVHAGRTSNHVLDVIGVTGAVDVRVVPVVGRVLDVRGGDGDTAFPLLGRPVDGAVLEVVGVPLLRLPLGDGRRERSL